MSEQRASIFEDDDSGDDFDVSGFAPKKQEEAKPEVPLEAIQTIARGAKFQSREAAAPAATKPIAKPAPAPEPARAQRRHRTGRNVQLIVKVKQETLDRFYQLADAQGWVLGETLEHAVIALEEKIANG